MCLLNPNLMQKKSEKRELANPKKTLQKDG